MHAKSLQSCNREIIEAAWELGQLMVVWLRGDDRGGEQLKEQELPASLA